MTTRRSSRPIRNRTNYELARDIAPHTEALLELRRRFEAEEARLTAALGVDDPPTFEDLLTWIVDRGTRPPHRPPGRRERPSAYARRSAAQRQRRERERTTQPAGATV